MKENIKALEDRLSVLVKEIHDTDDDRNEERIAEAKHLTELISQLKGENFNAFNKWFGIGCLAITTVVPLITPSITSVVLKKYEADGFIFPKTAISMFKKG